MWFVFFCFLRILCFIEYCETPDRVSAPLFSPCITEQQIDERLSSLVLHLCNVLLMEYSELKETHKVPPVILITFNLFNLYLFLKSNIILAGMMTIYNFILLLKKGIYLRLVTPTCYKGRFLQQYAF